MKKSKKKSLKHWEYPLTPARIFQKTLGLSLFAPLYSGSINVMKNAKGSII